MERFNDATSLISWIEKQRRFSPKTSLDKMKYLCQLFGNPENKFVSIHITGTNGKGSTVAYLRSILKEAGLNVATFTSPYVTIFNERIQYNENYISNDDLIKYSNMIIDKYDTIINDGYELPSFFEFITLLAFIYFSNLDDLDIALIEVGMGGRLDSTNVITPLISVITNIEFDHMAVLGNTLEEIATEKLGIVKDNVPVVIGTKYESLQKFMVNKIKDKTNEIHLTALRAFEIKKMDIYGSQILLKDLDYTFDLGLSGLHQIDNAIIAITVIEVLNKIYLKKKCNLEISYAILSKGLLNVNWPGRLEILSSKPLILTDGAHNIDGIRRVCEFIKKLNYKEKLAVVAISKDKELNEMIKLLDETFDEIIFTTYSYVRSSDASSLNELSHNSNHIFVNELDETLNIVKSRNREFNIFLGSLYLVTDIRKKFK